MLPYAIDINIHKQAFEDDATAFTKIKQQFIDNGYDVRGDLLRGAGDKMYYTIYINAYRRSDMDTAIFDLVARFVNKRCICSVTSRLDIF
jgi:hypothetical protein